MAQVEGAQSARGERDASVINNPHGPRHERARRDRPATTFQRIVSPAPPATLLSIHTDKSPPPPQCEHYLPLTTTSSRYID